MTEQPLPPDDPRVYFSCERTLLSWLRTGIGIIALGFVIARFGLFLRLMQVDGVKTPSAFSLYAGAFLVALGALAILLGTMRYRSYCKTLRPTEIPASSTPFLPTLLCLLISILGFILFTHLLL